VPRFAALRGDRQRKSVEVAEGVGGAGGLRLPDGGVSKCHAKLLEGRVMAWMLSSFPPFRQQKTGIRSPPIHGLKNGLKNLGCSWILVTFGKPRKTENLTFSTG
jgi:hypothetical protein